MLLTPAFAQPIQTGPTYMHSDSYVGGAQSLVLGIRKPERLTFECYRQGLQSKAATESIYLGPVQVINRDWAALYA